jgi:hydroxymethylpyrimidine/phosphomethylpyrimidine kinase
VRAIVSSLFPVATLVTVNLDEAAALAGVPVTNLAGMRRAAAVLASATGGAVLVKGGHLRAAPTDLLLNDGRETRMTSRRIRGSMHGSGCALASAAAAALAGGDDLATAVRRAREHVHSLIVSGVRIGRTRFRAPGPR